MYRATERMIYKGGSTGKQKTTVRNGCGGGKEETSEKVEEESGPRIQKPEMKKRIRRQGGKQGEREAPLNEPRPDDPSHYPRRRIRKWHGRATSRHRIYALKAPERWIASF